MTQLDTLLSVALGVGLAAAVGFRVFLPLLVTSLAAYSGYIEVGNSFAWLATLPAVITFAVAAAAEVLAYYVPVVDNLLDLIATPAAMIAGTGVAAAVMTDLPPLVKWTTAAIAGGGAAGLTQGITALLRAKSTATTGGLANPVVASGEVGGSLLVSVLALFAPLLAVALVILFCWLVIRFVRRMLRRRQTSEGALASVGDRERTQGS